MQLKSGGWAFLANCRRRRSTRPRQKSLSALPGRHSFNQLPPSRIPQDGFQVAVDASTGEVIGYASLMFVPGSTTVAWHDMTAVRRAYRGRGVARALKDATIA